MTGIRKRSSATRMTRYTIFSYAGCTSCCEQAISEQLLSVVVFIAIGGDVFEEAPVDVVVNMDDTIFSYAGCTSCCGQAA